MILASVGFCDCFASTVAAALGTVGVEFQTLVVQGIVLAGSSRDSPAVVIPSWECGLGTAQLQLGLCLPEL